MSTKIKTITMEVGRETEPKGLASFIITKESSTRANGSTICKMGLAKSIGLMAPTLGDISTKAIKSQANSNGPTRALTRDNL